MRDLFDEDIVTTKFEPTPRQNKLLQLMFLDDIDVDFVKTTMNITDDELKRMVEDLVKKGLLEYSSDDEVELTDEAIYHITSSNLDLF